MRIHINYSNDLFLSTNKELLLNTTKSAVPLNSAFRSLRIVLIILVRPVLQWLHLCYSWNI